MAEEFGFVPSLKQDKSDFGFVPEGDHIPAKSVLEQGAGVATAGFDLLGAIPGFVAGTGLAIGDVLTGQEPSIALEGAKGVMQEMSPLDKLADWGILSKEHLKSLRETEGYKIGSLPLEAISKTIEAIGQGYGNVAGLIFKSPELSKEIDAAVQLATMGLMMRGRPGAKPGTPEAYRDLTKVKPSLESLEESKKQRLGYPEKPIEIKDVDTTKLTQTEFGFVPEGELELPNVRPPYRVLPEAERARLEKELNPELEQRVTGQGELFTGEPPIYGPGELVAGRPVELGPASAIRTRPEPLETALGEVSKEFPTQHLSPKNTKLVERLIRMGLSKEQALAKVGARVGLMPYGRDLRLPVVGERESSYPAPMMGEKAMERSLEFKGPEAGVEGLRLREEEARTRADYKYQLETSEPIAFEKQGVIAKPDLGKGPGAKQRGAVEGIPFGKAAEKLADKWEKKRVELVGLRNRISKRIADGVGDIGWASKRVEEIQQEINKVAAKQSAALDVLYKEQHPDYAGFDIKPLPKVGETLWVDKWAEPGLMDKAIQVKAIEWHEVNGKNMPFVIWDREGREFGVPLDHFEGYTRADLPKGEGKIIPFKGPGKYQTGALLFDAKKGIGSVPYNIDVDYFGFVKKMSAQEFLKLAAKGDLSRKNIEYLKEQIKESKALGQPFFMVEWNKEAKEWEITGHEGRHRSTAILETEPNTEVPVHIFPRGLRSRDLTPEMKEAPFKPEYDPTKMYPKQRGAILIEKTLKNKGVVEAMKQYREQFMPEERPLKEVLKEATETGPLQDISDAYKGVTNVLIPKQAAILSKKVKGGGSIIKWAIDHVSKIEKDISQRTKVALEGEKYTTTRFGREKRLPSEEGGLTLFRDLYRKKSPELSEMKEVWINAIGKEQLTSDAFRTPRQWKVFAAMQGKLKSVWDEINKERILNNEKPFEYIKNYFPAMWEGDYRVWIKDAKGEVVDAKGAPTRGKAKQLQQELQKKHPEFQIEWSHVEKSRFDIYNLSAFEETIRILEKNDSLGAKDKASLQALNRTYGQILGKTGFAKHGAQKKGVLGYMGLEKGDLGLRRMEHAYEQYMIKAYRYIGNLEKNRLKQEIYSIPSEQRSKLRNTLDFVVDFIDHAKGDKLVDYSKVDVLGFIAKQAGLGQTYFNTLGHNLSGLILPYWLLTGRFAISQAVQSSIALPRLSQWQTMGDVKGTPIAEFVKGYKHGPLPDKVSIEGANWASRKGFIDPTVSTLLEFKLSEAPSSNMKAAQQFMRLPTSRLEQAMVRLPVFLIYERALRESVKEPEARFKRAAEAMDDDVVNYTRSNYPIGYTKLGLLGETAKPLKQFAHNQYGRFFEYFEYTKDTKEMKPLLYFLGTQVSLTGLKGAMFIPEVTALIVITNALLNTDIRTPEEWMLTGPIHDMLTHAGEAMNWSVDIINKAENAIVGGSLSTVLGYDVSTSVGAPGLPQIFSIPVLDLTSKIVGDVGLYLWKLLRGTATDQDAMQAWKSITPNAGHGFIEELYSRPGEPVPKPGDKMRGAYIRNEEEKWIASLFSLKSVDEAKANALVRAGKQMLMRDALQKMEALDAIADKVENKQPIPKELLGLYVEQGGDPSKLMEALKKRLIDRKLTWTQRQLKGEKITPNKAHRLQELKNQLDFEAREREERPGMKKMGTTRQQHISDLREDEERKAAIEETALTTLRARARMLFPKDGRKQLEYIKKEKMKEAEALDEQSNFFREHLRRNVYELNPKVQM